MKITIMTNNTGQIIGTFRSKPGGKDAPTGVRIQPMDGHVYQDVEIPDRLAKTNMLHTLHETHHVEIIDNQPKLVELK